MTKKLCDYSFQNLFYSCTSFFNRRWQLSIIVLLSSGTKSFGEIYRFHEGISKKVLCTNLKELIDRNIIVRKEYFDGHIKKTEYKLTKQGKELIYILEDLGAWGEKYYTEDDYEKKK